MAKHPIQPLEHDEHGVLRFKRNKIVEFLAKDRLNEIARMDFPQDDREQLAQLIGYSLSGFGDLSYVSNETYEAAQKDPGTSDLQARYDSIAQRLQRARSAMREGVAELYEIHPDDLS